MSRQGGRLQHRPPPPPPRPTSAASVHRDSRPISKPPAMVGSSRPKIKIWHVLPPETIHTDAANFRDLVQRLTGLQPAAPGSSRRRRRPTNKASSKPRNLLQADNNPPPLPPPPPPAGASEPSSSSSYENKEVEGACVWYEGIKQQVVEEEKEIRMLWMEESSSTGFLRALEQDQNGDHGDHDDDHDQFLLQGGQLGDHFHLLLPYY